MTSAGGLGMEAISSFKTYRVGVPDAVAAVRNTPQVLWYMARPNLLAAEVAYCKRL